MTDRMDRRSFLRYSAVAGVGASAATMLGTGAEADTPSPASRAAGPDAFPWLDATIAELQAAMVSGQRRHYRSRAITWLASRRWIGPARG